jgi:hypothetical protein
MQIDVTVSGSQQIIDKFKRLDAKLKDLSPEFVKLGEYLTGYFSGESFLSQGSVFGKHWNKLADGTTKSKSKKYPGRQPLERSGAMRSGFRAKTAPMQLTISNAVSYFGYHQSSEPRRVLPRRVMIGYNNTIKTKIRDTFHDGIARILQ